LNGDFCVVRKDAINHPRIKERPSQFIDKLKEYASSNLPLKVSAVKSERPETQHDLHGSGSLMTTCWLDIVQEAAPGLWINPMSLPAECVDLLLPDGNNWSPKHPEEWTRQDTSTLKPEEIKTKGEGEGERNLTRKHINNALGKDATDGRTQITKAKESYMTDVEQLAEAYNTIVKENFCPKCNSSDSGPKCTGCKNGTVNEVLNMDKNPSIEDMKAASQAPEGLEWSFHDILDWIDPPHAADIEVRATDEEGRVWSGIVTGDAIGDGSFTFDPANIEDVEEVTGANKDARAFGGGIPNEDVGLDR
jgi:hypothetical protein